MDTGRVAGSVRVASRTLAGRDVELTAALGALRAMAEGAPCVALVSGRAGIGKTRLMASLIEDVREDGMRVLSGACVYPGSAPFAPLIAAFRGADPPAVQVLDGLTGTIEMRRSRLFELLRTTFVGLARRGPTVLVVDDVHWSDRATRDALLYLCATAREGRWGLVVTFRDDEVAGKPVLRDFVEVLGRDAVVRLTLGPLTEAGVADQIEGISGDRPSEEVAARTWQRSGGIPLLVEEVVAADAAGVSGVPDHLRDLFLTRVRSLGAARPAVTVIAVAASSCDEQLVADVLEIEPAAAADALERAVAADVLAVDATGYTMRHDLLREAVHDALPPAQRRDLHGRIARALASRPRTDVTALAYHWYCAGEAAPAYATNLQSATLAERLHAPPSARMHLERALEFSDAAGAEGERAALLLRIAAAAELEGAWDRAAAWTEEVLELSQSAEERLLCLQRLMLYRWRGGDGHAAEAAFQELRSGLPSDASARVRARVLSSCAWFCYVSFHPDDAEQLADAALAAADECGDDVERCRALLSWGVSRGQPEIGLAALREARDLAAKLDVSEEFARSHIAIALALGRLGRSEERAGAIRVGLRELAAHGLARSFEAALEYQLVHALIELGEWDEADRLLADMRTRDLHGVPAMFASGHETMLAALRGEVEHCAAAAERTFAMGRQIPQQQYPIVTALLGLAEGALWAHELARALELVARAAGMVSDPELVVQVTSIQARAAADEAELDRRQGRAVIPDEFADRTVLADDISPIVRAHVATAVAERTRLERDPQPWRDALAAWEAATNPYRAAYCRWRLAHAALRSRSGRAEALTQLDDAWVTADSLAAVPLRSAIEETARTARLPLRGDRPADVGVRLGLTARELEILPLIVAGRTNAEIGDALVISPRTVGVHVSRILQKLGATRRTEAADIARRRGLYIG
jgi:DNA-binding CsgD family transcriptional regulator/tetratricopeptide (TPR) repeat protein